MKHLLIILSILLLSSFITSCGKNGSSPVIGDNHKGGILYQWGEWGDYKWMGFGDVETHPVYEGQVENGKPNGEGILTFPVIGDKYVGSWKNGKRHGKGEYIHPNGRKLVGEWKNDLPWNGTDYKGNGEIYRKIVNGKSVYQ